MKIAVVGSRGVVDPPIGDYISDDVEEIISGGAVGVDFSVAQFAKSRGLKLTEILPDYKRYRRVAPIKRNYTIVDMADEVIAFWDGKSRGTLSVIKYAEKVGKRCVVVLCK